MTTRSRRLVPKDAKVTATTHPATRRANQAYPKGTVVLYVDPDSKYRFGTILGAARGRLRIQTPVVPKRRTRDGITPRMARRVAHVDVVDPRAVLRVEREAA